MKVKSIKCGEQIRFKDLGKDLKISTLLKDFFIFKDGKGYVVIFKYGVVVFWGFSDKRIDAFLDRISPYVENKESAACFEEISVLYDKKEDEIVNSAVFLKDLDLRRVALVSELLSRSVALDSYEKEIENMLTGFGKITDDLCNKGRIFLSNKKLLRQVGFAMNTQHRVVSKLTVLDKPEITWDYADLDLFYQELSIEYEIFDRYEILKQKIEMIFRNIEFIMNYLDSKRAHMLELVIIGLILIEIVLFVPDFLSK